MNKIAFSILAICSLVLTVLGGSFLVRDMMTHRADKQMFEQVAALVDVQEAAEKDEVTSGADAVISQTDTASTADQSGADSKPASLYSRNLSALFAANDECIGWLSIDGTTLSYPVMHTPNEPTRYLRRNFYGEHSAAGVPFLDARCDLGNSDNLIFYGHRMKDGTMFSCLKKYKDADYLKSHRSILLEEADGSHCFEIFAVIETTKTDSWYCFTKAVNADEYDRMVKYAAQHSLHDTGIVPQYGDRLISLSTCHGSGSDGRIIVIGREVFA